MAALPNIYIDATFIVPKGKGVTVYATSLLQALADLDPPARFTILMRREAVEEINNWCQWAIQPVDVRSAHFWHLVTLPYLLRTQPVDLLHILGEAALGWISIPYTMVIHELPHLYRQRVQHPAPSRYQRMSQWISEQSLPGVCRRSAHLLALSQSTATDLVQEFNLPQQQVSVVYPGVARQFFHPAPPESTWSQMLPRPYLLIFATGDRREVPEQVVQAFGAIAAQVPHFLVIAGKCPDWQRAIITDAATQANCVDRLHFTGFVPSADLPKLYHDADVFVEMSRYEGFGLQVCEAMATGTAAIASNVASLPEVIGNAGDLVPLDAPEILAEKLLIRLTHSQQNLAKLAQQQASQFSWQQCAFQTWAVVQQVINQPTSAK
jgi:glycosyltransferase involved in cell wall biosynthesis